MTTQTKVWTKEEIKDLIGKSNKMVSRSLVKLFEKQTEDEKSSEETKHHNGVGFNGTDGKFLSSLAKQVLQGRTLTEKQLTHARKKLIKYSGQLAKIANGEM
jgi:hypothetical protein